MTADRQRDRTEPGRLGDGTMWVYERDPKWTDWLTGNHPKVWEGSELQWDEYHNWLTNPGGPGQLATEEFERQWHQPWW